MILDNYSYLYDVMRIATTAVTAPNVLTQPITTVDIEMCGSRLSAKTVQGGSKFPIEFGYQNDVQVATDIWRYDVAGANESYDELLGVLEDIYEIDANRKNSNVTKRTLKLPNNNIKVSGFLSNRKNKTPKLGKARKGIKKDVQINIFDEATEFASPKEIQMIQQATGGAKFVINIFIANPWVLSNWYIKRVNKSLTFNEKQLREKGEQLRQTYDKKKNKLTITHITNHRINTYLSQAQHQMLFDSWDISEQFARVVDLGMPGVAEGLIYAPILHKIGTPTRSMPLLDHRAGLDLGFSTGANASSTALLIGRVAKNYAFLTIDEEYYHSNSTQMYKTQDQICSEIIEKAMEYTIKNKDSIKASSTGKLTLSYDFMAFGWGSMLETELHKYHKRQRLIAELIDIVPCVKFRVPTRVNVVTTIMSQGRYKINKENCPKHWEELESAQWDETKLVKNQPTRENKNDHTLDASEYLIGADLVNFLDNNYFTLHKNIDLTKMENSFR